MQNPDRSNIPNVHNEDIFFDEFRIRDDGDVNYGKLKVCAWKDCTTILNHYRAKHTKYCCQHQEAALIREDQRIMEAYVERHRADGRKYKLKKKKEREDESPK